MYELEADTSVQVSVPQKLVRKNGRPVVYLQLVEKDIIYKLKEQIALLENKLALAELETAEMKKKAETAEQMYNECMDEIAQRIEKMDEIAQKTNNLCRQLCQ